MSVPYFGDFAEDDTVLIPFNTFSSDDPSASVTMTTLVDADIKVHKDGGVTAIATDGATIAINFNSQTGAHLITIDTSAHSDYATGSEYSVLIEGATVDGGNVTAWVGAFSIERAGGALARLETLITTVGVAGVGLTEAGGDGDHLTAINLPNQTMDITGDITGNLSGSVGSVTGGATSAELAKVPKSDGAVSWNATALAAIEAEALDALESVQLDHLVGVTTGVAADGDLETYCVAGSLMSHLLSAAADATNFKASTDSLQAVRDHIGDGTNLTEAGGDGDHLTESGGTGDQLTAINLPNQTMDIVGDITGNLSGSVGSVTGAVGSVAGNVDGDVSGTVILKNATHGGAAAAITLADYTNFQGAAGSDRLLMVDTTIATLASQTSFTLTAGSADDNAYNNCTIVIEDVSTAAQKAVGLVSDYTGASKTVTLKYDPGVFTMATTDKVYILAENALKSTAANRQLDVTATGATGIDWANVENPTTAVDLSATDIQLCDTITTYTGNTPQTADHVAELAKVPKSDSNVTWNATALGSINAEADTALSDYDPPTKAEMDTGHGLLATVAKQDIIDTNVDQIETAVITNAAGVDIAADIIALKAETATIVADTNELQGDWANAGRLDAILDSILAMLDDARTEPAQGAPPVNPDAMTKIDYLYKAWRNKKTATATAVNIYDDAGAVIDHKKTISDDGTTYTDGEVETGP